MAIDLDIRSETILPYDIGYTNANLIEAWGQFEWLGVWFSFQGQVSENSIEISIPPLVTILKEKALPESDRELPYILELYIDNEFITIF